MTTHKKSGYLTLLGELIDLGCISRQEAGWVQDVWRDFEQALLAGEPNRRGFMEAVTARLQRNVPRHNARRQLMNGPVGRIYRDCVYRLCLLRKPQGQRAQYLDFLRHCPQRPIVDVFIQSDETQAVFGERAGLAPDEMSRLVRGVVEGAPKKNLGTDKLREAFRRLQIVPSLQPFYEIPQTSLVIGKHEVASPFVVAAGGITSREQGLLELAALVIEADLSESDVVEQVQQVFGISDKMKARARGEWILKTLRKSLPERKGEVSRSILAGGQLAIFAKPLSDVKANDSVIATLPLLGIAFLRIVQLEVKIATLGIWDCDFLLWAKNNGAARRHGIELSSLDMPGVQKTFRNAIRSFKNANECYRVMTVPRSALPPELIVKSDDVAIANVFDGFNIVCNPSVAGTPVMDVLDPDEVAGFSGEVLPEFSPFAVEKFATNLVLFVYVHDLRILCHDDSGRAFWESLCDFAIAQIQNATNGIPIFAENLYGLVMVDHQSSAEGLAKAVSNDLSRLAICTGPTQYFANKYSLKECFDFRKFFRCLSGDLREYFAGVPIHTAVNVLGPEPPDPEFSKNLSRIQALAFDVVEQIARSNAPYIEFIADQMNADVQQWPSIAIAFEKAYAYQSPRTYRSSLFLSSSPYGVPQSVNRHLSDRERQRISELMQSAMSRSAVERREFENRKDHPMAQKSIEGVYMSSQEHYKTYLSSVAEFEWLSERLEECRKWIASTSPTPVLEEELKEVSELVNMMHEHFLTSHAVEILKVVFKFFDKTPSQPAMQEVSDPSRNSNSEDRIA